MAATKPSESLDGDSTGDAVEDATDDDADDDADDETEAAPADDPDPAASTPPAAARRSPAPAMTRAIQRATIAMTKFYRRNRMFLAGKRILIMGLLSNRSIAYGVAQACRKQGAELAFTYQTERFRDRITEMAAEFGSDKVFACDVAEDAQIEALFADLGKVWDGLDGVVHAVAFAPREAITGDLYDGLSREAFRVAHDISAYSFAAVGGAARPLMAGRKGALITLSYLGAVRAVPNYNIMGMAKASLEASVRYMATSLGPHGTRVNAISAGPIKTLAASGIKGFSKLLDFAEQHSPMRRNVTTEEVGNVAAFMLSDMASGITGEITYVDAGFSIGVPGMGEPS
jgi:enoyl-[acyl-carrier protein] reductase I